MEEKSGFGYFLLGLGIGVAAGLLWAPRSGEETRALLADKAGDSADYLRSRAQEGSDYIKNRAQEGSQYVKQRTGELKNTAADVYERGRSHVAHQKENLAAAVEAGKQAYHDAVNDVKAATSRAASTASE